MVEKEQSPDDALEKTLQEASDKLQLDVDVLRKITPEDIQYLLDHCPFLQIVGPEMSLEKQPVKIIQSESGWDIHDYGDAMSSSPGRLLFGGGDFRILVDDEGDEGGGGNIVNPGKGTLVNQAWLTASDMILLANERGWRLITIVDGHDLMKRAAWVKSVELDITIDGFEPDLKDERIRERVMESAEAMRLRQKAKQAVTIQSRKK